eukprot:jgi/Tetstr1/429628/TSEL_019526.t1
MLRGGNDTGAASTTTCAAAPEKINGATAKGGVSSEQKITAESLEWGERRHSSVPHFAFGVQQLRPVAARCVHREHGRRADGQPAISEMMKEEPTTITFERALAFILANRLADADDAANELFDILYDTLKTSPETVFASMQDCQAAMERDPRVPRLTPTQLLYYKGFHAPTATVLGNIRVGEGAQIAACSLVLKDVPERTMVAGTPAKLIGRVEGRPALEMHQWIKPIDLDPYDNTPSKEWSDLAGRVTNEVPSATATTTSSTSSGGTLDWGSDVDDKPVVSRSSDERLGEKLVAQAARRLRHRR